MMKKIKTAMLKRCRSEHAKKVRRLTGTNSFQDKIFVIGSYDISNTITTFQTLDTLLIEEYE